MKNTNTGTQILAMIIAYLETLSLKIPASSFFTPATFSEALVKKLPGSCILNQNRKKTSGNETHIAITGASKTFFYSQSFIDSCTVTTADIIQDAAVSKANIDALKPANRLTGKTYTSLDVVNTLFTHNIFIRSSGDKQVQVSKLNKDGDDFLELRKVLYDDDLLVFLKYRNENRIFVVGIPKEFYETRYKIAARSTPVGIHAEGTVSTKKALSDLAEETAEDSRLSDSEGLEDSIYQDAVNNDDLDNDLDENVEIDDAPRPYDKESEESHTKSNRPKTDANKGKRAIKQGHYQCIFDVGSDKHKTFRKPNGKLYMEAHHLIPMKEQGSFTNMLDQEANIIPLCPCCHRKIHYGSKAEKDAMLHDLYLKRFTRLKKCGLDILTDGTPLTESVLKKMY